MVGEPDFECWGNLWKASADDPEIDYDDWIDFLDSIQEYLRQTYDDFFDQFYFWNDFSGDRTLDLKIAGRSVLTASLISVLQQYLQVNGQQRWRIRIPIYFEPDSPRRVVVIYPHALDIPPLCEWPNPKGARCRSCYLTGSGSSHPHQETALNR